jgi:hypothetical protein
MNKPKLSEKKMLSVNFTEIREEIYFMEYILTMRGGRWLQNK